MANSLNNNIFHKTIPLHEKKDPYLKLWRSVLVIGIEDFLRKKEKQIQLNNRRYSLEEMWFYHEDFDLICEYAALEPKVVRKRVFEALERIEKKYENKKNMPEMSGKWLYKSKEISRGPNRHSTTMYDV
jgi:flagellar biosynthesis regulator FlbT